MKPSAACTRTKRLGMRVKSVRKRVWRSNPSATAEMMASRSDGSSGERVMSECPDGSARDTSRDQRGQSRAWGKRKAAVPGRRRGTAASFYERPREEERAFRNLYGSEDPGS